MGLKDLGVMLGGLVAVAGLSYARSRSASLSEDEDEDDDEDGSFRPPPTFGALGAYTDFANGFHDVGAPQIDGDLDMIFNEARLDMLHEGVKQAIRKQSPVYSDLGYVLSGSRDSYEGLMRETPEDWMDPNVRWLIWHVAQLQARSAHDRLSHMIPRTIFYGGQGEEDSPLTEPVFFKRPHRRDLSELAFLMSSMGAGAEQELDAGATAPSSLQIMRSEAIAKRGLPLSEEYERQMTELEKRETKMFAPPKKRRR